jgi:hypothetical protein
MAASTTFVVPETAKWAPVTREGKPRGEENRSATPPISDSGCSGCVPRVHMSAPNRVESPERSHRPVGPHVRSVGHAARVSGSGGEH